MAAAVIALLWLGMLIGVSFVATPVKFVVQDLTLPVALQVGQATFALFARIEWVFAAVLFFACAFAARERPISFVLAAVLGAVVLAQGAWLLPALDVRVDDIVAGGAPPPSSHHMLYAALEAAKAVALTALAVLALRQTKRPSGP
jgi:hypothetical protein